MSSVEVQELCIEGNKIQVAMQSSGITSDYRGEGNRSVGTVLMSQSRRKDIVV